MVETDRQAERWIWRGRQKVGDTEWELQSAKAGKGWLVPVPENQV